MDFLRHSGKVASGISAASLLGIIATLTTFPGSYSAFNEKEAKTIHLLAGLSFGSIALISGSAIACSLAGWEDSKLKAAVRGTKAATSAERTKKALEKRHEAALQAIEISAEQSRAGMVAALTGGFSTPTEEQQLTSQILPHIEPILVQSEMLFDQVFSGQFGYAVRLVPGGVKGQTAMMDQGSKEFKAFEVGMRSRLGDLVILPSGKGSLTAYVFNDQVPLSDEPQDFICDFKGVTSIPRELGQVVQVLGDPLDMIEPLITSLTACGEIVGMAILNGDQRALSRYQSDPRLVEVEAQTGVRVATNPDMIVTSIQKRCTTLIVLGACAADELAGRNRQVFVCDETGKYKPNATIDLRTFPMLQVGYDKFPVFIMSHQMSKKLEPTELKTIATPEVIQQYVAKCAEYVKRSHEAALAQNDPGIAENALDAVIEQLRPLPVFTAQSEQAWRSQILTGATEVREVRGTGERDRVSVF